MAWPKGDYNVSSNTGPQVETNPQTQRPLDSASDQESFEKATAQIIGMLEIIIDEVRSLHDRHSYTTKVLNSHVYETAQTLQDIVDTGQQLKLFCDDGRDYDGDVTDEQSD